MQTLTKKEWVAVVIVLLVVGVFFGAKFFPKNTNIDANVSTAAVNNNNMDQNKQNSGSAASTGVLVIKDVVVGTGAVAKNGDLVEVDYTGKFADGKVFDSSIPRGQPLPFTLGAGQVIPGWDQGILGMKVGGKRTLTIPADLGYGANGFPPVIPANATLYFDVQLVSVKAQ
jgi:FKBP-type peptidyl-prolyl cis-trans isomerase